MPSDMRLPVLDLSRLDEGETEAEAFRTLRDIAMKKRATIASIASKLVDTSDSLV